METVVLSLILVLLAIFIYLQFKIFKVKYPDESEVLGKDLPIGFRFMKDGNVIEVAGGKCSDRCVYYRCGCEDAACNGCYFKQVKK